MSSQSGDSTTTDDGSSILSVTSAASATSLVARDTTILSAPSGSQPTDSSAGPAATRRGSRAVSGDSWLPVQPHGQPHSPSSPSVVSWLPLPSSPTSFPAPASFANRPARSVSASARSPAPLNPGMYALSMLQHTQQQMDAAPDSPPPPSSIRVAGPLGNLLENPPVPYNRRHIHSSSSLRRRNRYNLRTPTADGPTSFPNGQSREI